MKSVLFTYYSNSVQDIFLENVESLIKNSELTYDEIVICSQIDIPIKVVKSLSENCLVNRVFPDHNSQSAKKTSNPNRPYQINPFVLTALSYKGAVVTVFDSHLFVINPIVTYAKHNIFYKSHSGVLNSKLFTMVNTDASCSLMVSALSGCDFTDDIVNRKFAFTVSNAIPFSATSVIHESSFIFSKPTATDLIHEAKLIALDMSENIGSLEIHKKMWATRKLHIPKMATLTKIKDSHSKSLIPNPTEVTKDQFKKLDNYDPIILYKYTSRSRPDKFYRGLISIINNSSSENYLILCSFDNNDPSLSSYLDYLKEINNDRITVCLGESKSKIDAINRDINDYSKHWDIVVNMSDDMVFTKDGFDLIIKSDFLQHFPKFDGVMHYPDQDAGRKLMTLSILGREYYLRFNYIYHPDYTSLWCDNEAMEVAMMLGKYKYSPARIFDHIHPAYGRCQTDEQYKHTESFYHSDNEIYLKRKAKGFKLDFAVLIATIESRKNQFEKLRSFLRSQILDNSLVGHCEIIHMCDNKEISIGLKRQRLLESANSQYLAFIDDDDWVSEEYFSAIMKSIKENSPDSIGFVIQCTFDQSSPVLAKASNIYSDWGENIDGFKYVRTPYHKTPIKRELAVQIGFKDLRYAEDHEYSRQLKAAGLIKNEDFINKIMYYYQYVHENMNTKYGFK